MVDGQAVFLGDRVFSTVLKPLSKVSIILFMRSWLSGLDDGLYHLVREALLFVYITETLHANSFRRPTKG